MVAIRPMTEAPREGEPVVAIYEDVSGICVVRWGETIEDGEDGWFVADYSDLIGGDDLFVGWLDCDELRAEMIHVKP